jgi:hypothetical protein
VRRRAGSQHPHCAGFVVRPLARLDCVGVPHGPPPRHLRRCHVRRVNLPWGGRSACGTAHPTRAHSVQRAVAQTSAGGPTSCRVHWGGGHVAGRDRLCRGRRLGARLESLPRGKARSAARVCTRPRAVAAWPGLKGSGRSTSAAALGPDPGPVAHDEVVCALAAPSPPAVDRATLAAVRQLSYADNTAAALNGA